MSGLWAKIGVCGVHIGWRECDCTCLAQGREVKLRNVHQQFDEAARGVVKDVIACFGRCCGSVPDDAFWRKIAHFPAEGVRTIGTKMHELLLETGLSRD